MKNLFCGLFLSGMALVLVLATAPRADNLSPRQARRLHFTRGATTLRVRGFLSGSQRRFYVLKTGAGQHLNISARAAAGGQLVPIIQVMPPRGQSDGEKTGTFSTNSTRAGDYKIEVAANLMASNARSGPFALSIRAH